jgi:hypothetical protein
MAAAAVAAATAEGLAVHTESSKRTRLVVRRPGAPEPPALAVPAASLSSLAQRQATAGS